MRNKYRNKKAVRMILILVLILALVSVIAILMYKIGAFTTIGGWFVSGWNAFKSWITNSSSEVLDESSVAARIYRAMSEALTAQAKAVLAFVA